MFNKLTLIVLKKFLEKVSKNHNISIDKVGNHLVVSIHGYLYDQEQNKTDHKLQRKLDK